MKGKVNFDKKMIEDYYSDEEEPIRFNMKGEVNFHKKMIEDYYSDEEELFGSSKYRTYSTHNNHPSISRFNNIIANPRTGRLEITELEDEEEELSPIHDNSVTEKSTASLPINSASSSSADALWEGHLVSKSYIDLLSQIKLHHPQTFEKAKFSTTAVDSFAYNFFGEFFTSLAKTLIVDVQLVDIAYFKKALADLEKFNFDMEWLKYRIEKIEYVKFLNPLVPELNDLKKRAQEKENELAKVMAEVDELKKLCREKAAKVSVVHGDLGEKIETMRLVDGLLPKKT